MPERSIRSCAEDVSAIDEEYDDDFEEKGDETEDDGELHDFLELLEFDEFEDENIRNGRSINALARTKKSLTKFLPPCEEEYVFAKSRRLVVFER